MGKVNEQALPVQPQALLSAVVSSVRLMEPHHADPVRGGGAKLGTARCEDSSGRIGRHCGRTCVGGGCRCGCVDRGV